ncbi:hypothetical protein [Roseiconus lacunae]|uniref:Secreted protein n=1 Tax=Roseiconus lacunae TaxID=2605694 RepID=A0ABT7PSQ4_9BACT|nr:hypothetical protein [Roseiconus lacunae]MDM4019527.1 hypothetical protein [Roseiconus lacunae]
MQIRRSKLVASVLALWVVLSLASFVTEFTFPALFNRVNEIEYGCSDPTIVEGIWIRPCVNSESRGFTIPLLFSSHSTGPPFSIGITVLDYADNAIDCHHVVVDELVVTIDGKQTSLLNDGPIEAPSQAYFSGTTSTKADAYTDLGNLGGADNDSVIHLNATVRIYTTDDRVIKQTVSGVFERGGWQGTWFILEALFPHA